MSITLTNNAKTGVSFDNKREPNIELLRMVLMVMIVCYHFFSLYIKDTYHSNQLLFFTKLFFTSITAMAVDCFVFISGYYGLKFKLKQVITLALQAIFYSYICFTILYFVKPELINSTIFFKYLFPVSSSLWWFVTTYILLYFIAPFLNEGIKKLSKIQYQIILIGFLYLNCFSNFLFDLDMAGHLVNFIFIYLFARYINIYKVTISHPFIIYTLLILSIFIINAGATILLANPVISASRYTSIFCILSAACLFLGFKKIKIKSNIAFKIAPLCLGVYLFHFNYFMWNMVIMQLLFSIEKNYQYNLILFTILYTTLALIVFVLGIGFEKIRQIICQPLLNFIGKKIDKFSLNI